MDLKFYYSACAVFVDLENKATELRVVLVQARSLDDAVPIADASMKKYASDFNMNYSGALCVYEYGSDMLEDYGEVFSTTWNSDEAFDGMLEKKLTE